MELGLYVSPPMFFPGCLFPFAISHFFLGILIFPQGTER